MKQQTAKQIKTWQEMYDQLVQLCPDLVITVTDGKIVSINQAGLGILGASGPQDVIGKPLSDLAASYETGSTALDSVTDIRRQCSTEEDWVKLDGTTIKLEVSSMPVAMDGQQTVHIIARDMTLLRRAEQMLLESQSHHRRLMELYLDLIGVETTRTAELHAALRRARDVDELKSQLLSTVSHELRTPLTTIRGQTSTLLDYADQISPADRLEALRIIDQEATRLDELISHILDMSRIESGSLRVELVATDVGPILQETVARFATQAPRHRLLAIVPARLPLVQADPRRVRQVLCNLLENAIKFSQEGSAITVNTWDTPESLWINVKDEGCGIAPEHLRHVFDRFYRIEGTSKRTSGVGLGLAISKGLVEAMGGRVSASSQPGTGSNFSFSLPLTSGVRDHAQN